MFADDSIIPSLYQICNLLVATVKNFVLISRKLKGKLRILRSTGPFLGCKIIQEEIPSVL